MPGVRTADGRRVGISESVSAAERRGDPGGGGELQCRMSEWGSGS